MSRGTVDHAIRLAGTPWTPDGLFGVTFGYFDTVSELPQFYQDGARLPFPGSTLSTNPTYLSKFDALTTGERAYIDSIFLQKMSSFVSVTFTRMVDVSDAAIKFGGLTYQPSQSVPGGTQTWPGWTGPPSHLQIPGHVWLAPDGRDVDNFEWTVTHEAGHSVGLHDANDNHPDGHHFLSGVEDDHKFSIMSYTGSHPSDYQLYDIAALQYMYGRNDDVSNDTYAQFTNPKSIWDGGGIDLIDISSYNKEQYLDMRPGSFSTIGSRSNANIENNEIQNSGHEDISIAFGSILENAKGSSANDAILGNAYSNSISGGGGDDLIYGDGEDFDHVDPEYDDVYDSVSKGAIQQNSVNPGSQSDTLSGEGGKDRLYGSIGADSISGGSEADTLIGGRGNDVLDGGEGADDLAQFSEDCRNYKITKDEQSGTWTVEHLRGSQSDGKDILTNIEKVKFADGAVKDLKLGICGADLSLVIDTTGSMSDDIAGVKAAATTLVNAVFEQNQGSRISILGYKDPGETQTYLEFTDQDTVAARKAAAIAAIQSLTVDGGGDTPEGVFSGLKAALTGALGDWNPDAHVHRIVLFGDAGPKDTWLQAEVESLAKSLSVSGAAISSAWSGPSTLSLSVMAVNAEGEFETNYVEIYTVTTGSDVSIGDEFGDISSHNSGASYSGVSQLLAAVTAPVIPTIFGGGDNDTLSATGAGQRLRGDLGDDLLTGAQGNDFLYGEDGADTLQGAAGADQLDGGAGGDSLAGDAGNDTIIGGAGLDVASFSGPRANYTINTTVFGTTITNTVTGEVDKLQTVESVVFSDQTVQLQVNFNLTGASGSDTLVGGPGDDSLTNSGYDSLVGGAGDDVFLLGDVGADVAGGLGNDTANYSQTPDAVYVNLASEYGYWFDGYDYLASIENVIGSAFDDEIEGSEGANILDGGSGEDWLHLWSAEHGVHLDLLTNTSVDSETNVVDTILNFENVSVSEFDNFLGGTDSNNELYAGSGNDTINARGGNDEIGGGGGNDVLDGGSGIDTLYYDAFQDAVMADLSVSGPQNTGGAGVDAISNIENLVGSYSNDTLGGSAGANLLLGGDGDDSLSGAGDNDTLSGEYGNDTLTGGVGADVLTGGQGADRFILSNSSESTGGSRDQILDFSRVEGDKIDLSLLDANTLQAGIQPFALVSNYTNTPGELTVVQENDYWVLKGDQNGDGASEFFLHVYSATKPGFEDLLGVSGYRTVGTSGSETITGTAGADTLSSSGGADQIEGVSGDDVMDGGSGLDTLTYASATAAVNVSLALASAQNTGGAGIDTITGFEKLIGSGYNDTLAGSSSADTLVGGAGADSLSGGGGDDLVQGGAGNDALDGGAGANTVDYSDAAAAVTVSLATTSSQNTGGGGNDTLTNFQAVLGSAFNDVLTGDGGANTLTGGEGDDTLAGGSGADVFVYRTSTESDHTRDRITDFSHAAADKIDLSAIDARFDEAGNQDFRLVSAYTNTPGDLMLVTDGDHYLVKADTNGDGASDVFIDVYSSTALTFDDLIGVTGVYKAGTSGADTHSGSSGADTLSGSGGADQIDGGAGDDMLDGGSGDDTLTYASATAAVNVSLAVATAQNTGGAGVDTITGFEKLVGSGYNDTLAGSTSADTVIGGAGADSLSGAGGDDVLQGGAGDDTLDGGAGVNTIDYSDAASAVTASLATSGSQNTGGGGSDTIASFQRVLGSTYADVLTGDGAANTLTGGGGADSLTGGAGADIFVLRFTSESTNSARDRIVDFSRADGDKIDFSAIDPDSSTAGDQAFTVVASYTNQKGQIVVETEGDHYLVKGDTNGDGSSDFMINVYSSIKPTAVDFIL